MEKQLKERIDRLAILKVQEAKFWQLCRDVNSEVLTEKYRKFKAELDQIEKVEFSDLNYDVSITGFSSKISHYDIDDDLVKVFGDKVRADSEGSMFSTYVRKANLEEVLEYLKKYDSLKVECVSNLDYVVGYFTNWSEAERYAKENNLVIPDLPIDLDKINKLQELRKKQEELQKEIERIDVEIANLF